MRRHFSPSRAVDGIDRRGYTRSGVGCGEANARSGVVYAKVRIFGLALTSVLHYSTVLWEPPTLPLIVRAATPKVEDPITAPYPKQ